MISVDDALKRITENVPLWDKTLSVPAKQSVGSVLAEDVTAKRDVPRFDNSAMDGFVLRKDDWERGQRSFPVAFEVRPENPNPKPVPHGKCARIMTGAPIPEHGTQVIPVELAVEKNNEITFRDIPGRNPIRLQGEGYKKGKTVLKKGSIIRPYEMGLILESGNKECTVFAPLKIGLQVTGSEIEESMNTNGPVLKQIIQSWPGVEVKEWPVLEDDPDTVKKRLLALKEESDIIITTGGISAGKHDYLYSELQKLGAGFLIRKINQKPGKPFTFSIWDSMPVCNLPGNPVSAVFCAEMYARRVVSEMFSLSMTDSIVSAANTLENPGTKTLFVPGFVSVEKGKITVSAKAQMKSHLLQLYNKNNVYVRLDPESAYQSGDDISVIPFSNGSLPWM
jgi:molybdopterin molybdotransferase